MSRAATPAGPRWRNPPSGTHRLSVVLPAYEEAGRIRETVSRIGSELGGVLGRSSLELVVVDDGSCDDTARAAEEAGADRVLRHERNRGKGAAVRTGALAAGGGVVAFTDSDLAYSPDHLLELLETVEEGWDVVVGDRHHPEAEAIVEARLLRRLGGRLINRLTNLVLTGDHRDTQCGLKGFRAEVSRTLFAHTRIEGFAFDVEVLHLVERWGLSLTGIPVRVVNSSTSTVHVIRDGLTLVRDLVRIRELGRSGDYDLTPSELASLGLGDREPGG